MSVETYTYYGDSMSAKIKLTDGKVVEASYCYSKGGKPRVEQRKESQKFEDVFKNAMSILMRNNTTIYKELLRKLQNSDLHYFTIGKKMLDEEREKYTF